MDKKFKLLLLLFMYFIIPMSLHANIHFEEPWGKDSTLLYYPQKKLEEERQKLSIFSKAIDKVITFKQKVISPVDGPRSSFRPTSSRYMQLAIYRYGLLKGFIMGCDRLLRENNEKWIYRTIVIDNIEYKYDPAVENKYLK